MEIKRQRLNARPDFKKSTYIHPGGLFNIEIINKLNFNDIDAVVHNVLRRANIRDLPLIYGNYAYQYELEVYRHNLAWYLFEQRMLSEGPEIMNFINCDLNNFNAELIFQCNNTLVLALALAYRLQFRGTYINNHGGLIAGHLKILSFQPFFQRYYEQVPSDIVDTLLCQNLDYLRQITNFLTNKETETSLPLSMGVGIIYRTLMFAMIEYVQTQHPFLLDKQLPRAMRNCMFKYLLEYNWEREPKVKHKIKALLEDVEATYQKQIIYHQLTVEDIIWIIWLLSRKMPYDATQRAFLSSLWKIRSANPLDYDYLTSLTDRAVILSTSFC